MIAQLHKQSLLGKQMIAYLLHIRDTSFGTSGSFFIVCGYTSAIAKEK